MKIGDNKETQIEEIKEMINSFDEYKAYPHELIIMKFHEYFKLHRNSMKEIFDTETIFPQTIKYYLAIIVSTNLFYIYNCILIQNRLLALLKAITVLNYLNFYIYSQVERKYG